MDQKKTSRAFLHGKLSPLVPHFSLEENRETLRIDFDSLGERERGREGGRERERERERERRKKSKRDFAGSCSFANRLLTSSSLVGSSLALSVSLSLSLPLFVSYFNSFSPLTEARAPMRLRPLSRPRAEMQEGHTHTKTKQNKMRLQGKAVHLFVLSLSLSTHKNFV